MLYVCSIRYMPYDYDGTRSSFKDFPFLHALIIIIMDPELRATIIIAVAINVVRTYVARYTRSNNAWIGFLQSKKLLKEMCSAKKEKKVAVLLYRSGRFHALNENIHINEWAIHLKNE